MLDCIICTFLLEYRKPKEPNQQTVRHIVFICNLTSNNKLVMGIALVSNIIKTMHDFIISCSPWQLNYMHVNLQPRIIHDTQSTPISHKCNPILPTCALPDSFPQRLGCKVEGERFSRYFIQFRGFILCLFSFILSVYACVILLFFLLFSFWYFRVILFQIFLFCVLLSSFCVSFLVMGWLALPLGGLNCAGCAVLVLPLGWLALPLVGLCWLCLWLGCAGSASAGLAGSA